MIRPKELLWKTGITGKETAKVSNTQENSDIDFRESKDEIVESKEAPGDSQIAESKSEDTSTELSEVETQQYANKVESSTRMTLKEKLYEIIFEADTVGGKAFDIALLVFILGSVVVVMLDSVKSLSIEHDDLFHALEWGFTIIFTIEYALRLYCSPNRFKYATSFFGTIDFIAILPTYIGIFLSGAQYIMIVRILRLLRLFRIFKLGRFLAEAETMVVALKASGPKISVFLFFVLTSVSIVGALMYLIEGEAHGFTSIPRSIYWAIVTLTTVGYGDIAPSTILGQIVACTVMILGYGIIAVPTGIVSVEMHKASKTTELVNCNNCGAKDHQTSSSFCHKCGSKLTSIQIPTD